MLTETVEFTSTHPRVSYVDVLTLAVVPNPPRLLAGLKDISLRLVGLDPLVELADASLSTPAFAIASRAGRWVLGGASFNVRFGLFAVEDDRLQRVAVRRDHSDRLVHGAFSPDGHMFATTSYDGTARLYRTEGAVPYAVLSSHGAEVTHVEFSPDGRSLVTASRDRTARIWPVDPLALAIERKPRELLDEEWATIEVREQDGGLGELPRD